MSNKRCSGCFMEYNNKTSGGWGYFTFKYLKASLLCPDCLKIWAVHNTKLQSRGL